MSLHWSQMANVYLRSFPDSKPKEAAKCADKAILLDKQNINAFIVHAYIAVRKQNIAEYSEQMMKASEIDPNHPELKRLNDMVVKRREEQIKQMEEEAEEEELTEAEEAELTSRKRKKKKKKKGKKKTNKHKK